MLDLDSINTGEGVVKESNYRFQEILQYPAADVEDKSLKSIFVRGSSRKEVIQLNQKLIIFLQHEEKLFAWVDGGEKRLVCVNPKYSVGITSKELVIQDDNRFWFQQNSIFRNESVSQIVRVNLGFSDFNSEVIQQEDSPQFDFCEFKIDRQKEILLIFITESEKQLRKKLYVKILSLKDLDQVILECEIIDDEMKGIFRSGFYKL